MRRIDKVVHILVPENFYGYLNSLSPLHSNYIMTINYIPNIRFKKSTSLKQETSLKGTFDPRSVPRVYRKCTVKRSYRKLDLFKESDSKTQKVL